MSNQPSQISFPEGEVLEQGGDFPYLALYIQNIRFSYNNEVEIIEAISNQIKTRVQNYEAKRKYNEHIYPPLLLSASDAAGTPYDLTPGAPQGLEYTLKHYFLNAPAGHLAAHIEYYLSVLAFWNRHAFMQLIAWRGLRGETKKERERRLSDYALPPPWKRNDEGARMEFEEMEVQRMGEDEDE